MATATLLQTTVSAPRSGDRTWGALLAVLLHGALVAAVLLTVSGLQVTAPTPIMVSFIADPVPEQLPVPAPRQQIQPKPVVRPNPTPKPAEKPLLAAAAAAPAGPAAPAEQAPAAPQVPTVAAVQAAVSPPRFDAAYLDNPAPPYPPLARRMREQGVVLLRVLVNPDGKPDQVELKNGSGSARLDQSALDTVRRWRFVPARQGSQAVAAWVLVPISFTLGG